MTEILHVVLVQWSGDAVESERRASALVHEHLGRVDGIVSHDVGPSVSTEGLEGPFDWMLVVRFRDREALDAYLPHPEHQPVAEFLGRSSESLVVFDIDAGR